MANATPIPETSKKPKPRKSTKGFRNPLPFKVRRTPADKDMIPLREAHQLLKHLPGYRSLASMRLRVLVHKELPFQKLGKRGDIWVHGPAVHEMAGKHKDEFAPPVPVETEDQRLLKHYAEDEAHNYITAVTAGLASTLAHAKHVYEEFRAAKSDPVIVAIEAKRTREAQLARPETRCATCDRTEKLAMEDDLRVVREVTGGRDVLETGEEGALSDYRDFRCKGCWYWRPHAPAGKMRDQLLRSPPDNSQNQSTDGGPGPGA
jgi:hypothetical protein